MCKDLLNWISIPLSSGKSKKIADSFQVQFDSAFSLRRPLLDKSILRRMKSLKVLSKSTLNTEKLWKDAQAKLLDMANPLLSILCSAEGDASAEIRRAAKALGVLWGNINATCSHNRTGSF